ncbi:centrosomal protein of 63 kDa [Acipenser ruthenus]|uniref:centrosomal protein of 63 kDa n=1 Tax=Acipenser ruthenus TaxID=7906 RepID=UPI002741A166|nr:centrosomal protein of 63 kDa [Acipenser ruthenus]
MKLLTGKCNLLVWEKEKLDRECFEARERERGLRNDLNVLSHQLYLQEKVNRELRGTLEQLTNEVQHKRELVDILQQQVKMLVEDSAQNNSVLGQDLENIFLDLEQLQGTESHLKNLVEKLQQENKVKTKHVNYLQAELERKTHELQESQRLHEHAISEQRKENQGS